MVRENKIMVTSAYIGYNQAEVGGYSFYYVDEPDNHGMCDFVPYDEVLRIAEKYGLKRISLAGDWSDLNHHRGWGRKVTLPVAKKIIKEKRRL